MRLADDIGARRAVVTSLALSVAALLAVALAPSLAVLLMAALMVGVAQASGNPGTNKLIAVHVPAGSRGVITGVKQSGVQAGTFLGGVLLPIGAALWGWRGAVLASAVLTAVILTASKWTLPSDPTATGHGLVGVARAGLPTDTLRRLSLYGLLLGAAGSAVFTFLPLYAQDELGQTPLAAGSALALTGLVGVGARIGWARLAETSLGPQRVLRVIALIAVVSAGSFLASPSAGAGPMWAGAVLAGLSLSGWNAVAMLAVIQEMPPGAIGKASGVVVVGFYTGIAVGAPVFGWSVDSTGSYRFGWAAVGASAAAAWLLMRTRMDTKRASGVASG